MSEKIQEIKLRAFNPIFPDEMLDALLEVVGKLNQVIEVINSEKPFDKTNIENNKIVAKELQKQGYSIRQIGKKLGYKGIGGVQNLLK